MSERDESRVLELVCNLASNDYSKEGFYKTFMILKDTYKEDVLTKEEYEKMRKESLDELLNGKSSILFLVNLFCWVALLLFFIYMYIEESTFFIYPIIISVLIGVVVNLKLYRPYASSKSLTVGDRQEIIGYLFTEKLITSNESVMLNDKLLKGLSE